MRVYGWKRDLPDKRDRYHAPAPVASLPLLVDPRDDLPNCWNQLSLGACTAFAIGGALAYEYALLDVDFDPSFLHLYFEEREDEGTIPIDAGAFIRTGCKIVAQEGMASSALWPYVPSRFAQKPPKSVRKDALNHRISSYARVRQTRLELCSTLAARDTIVFGASIYESFESTEVNESGIVPLPSVGEDMLGGHAILIVGYDEINKWFIVRNSWSDFWGDGGYCYIPYDYVLDPDLCADFWVLKAVT